MANDSRSRTTCDRFHRELSVASTLKRGLLLSQPNLGNDDHKSFVRSRPTISKARLTPKRLKFPLRKPRPAKRSLPMIAVLSKNRLSPGLALCSKLGNFGNMRLYVHRNIQVCWGRGNRGVVNVLTDSWGLTSTATSTAD